MYVFFIFRLVHCFLLVILPAFCLLILSILIWGDCNDCTTKSCRSQPLIHPLLFPVSVACTYMHTCDFHRIFYIKNDRNQGNLSWVGSGLYFFFSPIAGSVASYIIYFLLVSSAVSFLLPFIHTSFRTAFLLLKIVSVCARERKARRRPCRMKKRDKKWSVTSLERGSLCFFFYSEWENYSVSVPVQP